MHPASPLKQPLSAAMQAFLLRQHEAITSPLPPPHTEEEETAYHGEEEQQHQD